MSSRSRSVARLSRLERSHGDDQHRLRRTAETARARADRAREKIGSLERLIEARTDTRGDNFVMVVDGVAHSKRADAGTHALRVLGERLSAVPHDGHDTMRLGTLGGLAIDAELDRRIEDEARVVIQGADSIRLGADELRTGDPSSLVVRLERRIQNLDAKLDLAITDRRDAESEAERADDRLGTPFEHADELQRLRRRQAEINESLLEDNSPPAPAVEPDEVERMRTRFNEPVVPSPGLAR